MNFLDFNFFMMLTVFISYVSFIWIRYSVQPSISESYYKLPKSINFLFTLFCWGFAMPAVIIGVDLTDFFLMFLAGAGIMLVGAAAAFKETLTKTVHTVGAVTGVLFSQLSIAFDFHMYYMNAIFVILAGGIVLINAISPKTVIKNQTWWIEMITFISICYVLGSQLF